MLTKKELDELRQRFESPLVSDIHHFFRSGTLFELLDQIEELQSRLERSEKQRREARQ